MGLIDDLRKAKSVHQKNVDKYTKLVHDTESLIKSSKQESDQIETNDASNNPKYHTESLKEGKDSTKIDMVNRSLSKMI